MSPLKIGTKLAKMHVFAGSVLCCGEVGVWRLVTALVNPSVLASAAVSGRRKYLHFKRISQKLVVEVCPENCASLMSALTRLVTPAQLHWRHSSPGALLLSHLQDTKQTNPTRPL